MDARLRYRLHAAIKEALENPLRSKAMDDENDREETAALLADITLNVFEDWEANHDGHDAE